MDAGAPAALTAERVSHRFGAREVRCGELLAVIGPNGAGKTTLLSVLAGVLKPDEGTVRLGSAPTRACARVGWVPQESALYSRLTVAENLRLFAELERVSDTEQTVASMLVQTGLAGRADDRVSELSGGNRQRVNIAIGLLAEPAVLLLDEPSASLDPRQRARLWEFIAAMAGRGTSLVYSTHDLHEAREHADRVLALEDGRVRFFGPPAELDWSY